jgi:hypothetical protein
MFFQSGDIVMVAYAAKDGTTANDGPGASFPPHQRCKRFVCGARRITWNR